MKKLLLLIPALILSACYSKNDWVSIYSYNPQKGDQFGHHIMEYYDLTSIKVVDHQKNLRSVTLKAEYAPYAHKAISHTYKKSVTLDCNTQSIAYINYIKECNPVGAFCKTVQQKTSYPEYIKQQSDTSSPLTLGVPVPTLMYDATKTIEAVCATVQ